MKTVAEFTKSKKQTFFWRRWNDFKNNFDFFDSNSSRIIFDEFFQEFVYAIKRKIIRFFIFNKSLIITIFRKRFFVTIFVFVAIFGKFFMSIFFIQFMNSTNDRFILTNAFFKTFQNVVVFFSWNRCLQMWFEFVS